MGRTPPLSAGIKEVLLRNAREGGFPLSGLVDIDLAFESGEIQKHIARYDEWLATGRAGAMTYLERGRDRRADPRLVFPEAKSILCVALPYESLPAGASDPGLGPRYARYLHSGDYHKSIAERLEGVMLAARSELGESLQWKVCVDTSAVLERSWAALAGLGWIGKNTLLIRPQHGSYLFLGAVLINQSTGSSPAPLKDFCGHCSRCLVSCPTRAITEPRVLDSRLCISYLTLEKRGALEIDPERKKAMGPWVAGCDICQEVCPFNLKTSKKRSVQSHELPDMGATHLLEWQALLEETPEQYRTRVSDSALKRVKPQQFSRNLAAALTNSIESRAIPSSSLLTLLPEIEKRLACEADPDAKLEWSRCLDAASKSAVK